MFSGAVQLTQYEELEERNETNVSVYKVQGIVSDDQHMVYQLNEGLPVLVSAASVLIAVY